MRTAIFATALALLVPALAEAEQVAPEALQQFLDLKHHPATLGFHPTSVPQLTLNDHWQSIMRAPSAGTPYFFLSKSDNDHNYGSLAVLEMGSRNSLEGERIRSNRIAATPNETQDRIPPTQDKIVYFGTFDGAGGWPRYNHAGGMEIHDNVLFVALENPVGTNPCANGSDGMVVLFDVSNPKSPQLLPPRICGPDGKKIGMVAVTRQSSGHYVMVMADDGNTWWVYRSTSTDLLDPSIGFELKSVYGVPPFFPIGPAAYQTINFIRSSGTDTNLYLVGNHSPFGVPGVLDNVDIWKVTLTGTTTPILSLSDRIDRVVFCNSPSFGRACDLTAAGGWYVSPTGQLLFYATEHEKGGPSGTTRMAEFYNSRVTYTGTGDACETYVELYDDDNGWNGSDRSVVFDLRDRHLANWHNLENHENFGDKTSSVRWLLPHGTLVQLYEHDSYGGKWLNLWGNGMLQEHADLGNVNWTIGSGTVGGEVSSVFVAATQQRPPVTVNVPRDRATLAEALRLAESHPCSHVSFYKGTHPVPTVPNVINQQVKFSSRAGTATISD